MHVTGRPTGTLAAVVIIIGSSVVSCGGARPTSSAEPAAISAQQCVQAVFDALSGMITNPHEDQPFAAFVSRFGTQSPAYAAYQDTLGPFYSKAVASGLPAAKDNVRTTVARDCATN